MHARAGESDRAIKVKMVSTYLFYCYCYHLLIIKYAMQPKHLFSGKRKGGKTSRR